MPANLTEQTINDFGRQWRAFRDNSGRYGSLELFDDFITPLLTRNDFAGARVVDIGSGTGRIAFMVLASGAAHVTAVEPSSDACEVLRENVRQLPPGMAQRVDVVQARGDQWRVENPVDYIISVGVIQFIPDPRATIEAAFRALKPGGRCFVWVYAREGNEAYLTVIRPLRGVTTRLPHGLLRAAVACLYPLAVAYRHVGRLVRLPQRDYVEQVWWTLPPEKRRLVMYDQLNPAYAKYYTHAEAIDLLAGAGFVDVRAFHRHGYSWSVIGTKPS